MLHVYGIKNCNTVKKALEWLNNNKIAEAKGSSKKEAEQKAAKKAYKIVF